MSAGELSERGSQRPLLRLRGLLPGGEKRVLAPDGTLLLRTIVRRSGAQTGSVRDKQYVMQDGNGAELAVARPDYADGDDPASAGWPVCRLPRVDRALVQMGGESCRLVMESGRSYTLSDRDGRSLVRVTHRGAPGGWSILALDRFRPELLAGLFVFCRYIEKENEFTVV